MRDSGTIQPAQHGCTALSHLKASRPQSVGRAAWGDTAPRCQAPPEDRLQLTSPLPLSLPGSGPEPAEPGGCVCPAGADQPQRPNAAQPGGAGLHHQVPRRQVRSPAQLSRKMGQRSQAWAGAREVGLQSKAERWAFSPLSPRTPFPRAPDLKGSCKDPRAQM